MSTFSRARASYPAFPMTGSIYRHLQRNWGESGPKGGLPAVGLKLNDLVQRLQVSHPLKNAIIEQNILALY